MTREIKFRAWNKKHNIMISWEQMKIDNTVTISFGSDDSVRELMQYTGLKDKNGKEVYEGDIVYAEMKNPDFKFEHIFHIEYNRYDCCFTLTVRDGQNVGYFNDLVSKNTIEVIGNVYENTELLGTTKMYNYLGLSSKDK